MMDFGGLGAPNGVGLLELTVEEVLLGEQASVCRALVVELDFGGGDVRLEVLELALESHNLGLQGLIGLFEFF